MPPEFGTHQRMSPESLGVVAVGTTQVPSSLCPRGALGPQQAHSSIPTTFAAPCPQSPCAHGWPCKKMRRAQNGLTTTGANPVALQPSEPMPHVNLAGYIRPSTNQRAATEGVDADAIEQARDGHRPKEDVRLPLPLLDHESS